MNTMNHDTTEPGAIEALLPWHAAGTLSAADARRVEEALANDPELARQYEAVREELGEAIHLNENLGAPSARAMQKLFAAIDAEPARKPAISFNLAGKITDFFASLAPRTMAYASAAAAIAILLQAGVIGTVLVKDGGGKFQSASFSDNHPEAGAYALVQFTPDAKAGDIMAFLGSYDAWIVEGPKAGMFRVRLGDKPLSKTELDGLLTKLQGEKVISFVAPAQ